MAVMKLSLTNFSKAFGALPFFSLLIYFMHPKSNSQEYNKQRFSSHSAWSKLEEGALSNNDIQQPKQLLKWSCLKSLELEV